MSPAVNSKRFHSQTKMMVASADGIQHTKVEHLAEYLNSGDLLVLNRSGTLPASFSGRIRGQDIEIRLAAFRGLNRHDLSRWMAIGFGSGSWRQTTEERGSMPHLRVGDRIRIGSDLSSEVTQVDPLSPRLLEVRFHSSDLVRELYSHGRPIQYSYLTEALEVWDQQTAFADLPISVEPPSAGFPLNWDILLKLRGRGVRLATVLHGAGLSSTGDPALDARLPLPEFFEVPDRTMQEVERVRKSGGRVMALGTTVTRALESAARGIQGWTSFKLGPETPLQVVDALFTGMHEEGTSHAQLMRSFCGCGMVEKITGEAEKMGYRSHEFGDVTLLDCHSR